MWTSWKFWAVWMIVLGLIILLSFGFTTDPKKVPSPLVGRLAPDFKVDELNGEQKFSLSEFKGIPIVLNFWASWCLPCLVEHPILMALKGKENLTIIGINYKDKDNDAAEFLREHGDPYDYIGVDKDGLFGIEMGITGVPETFIIDENGKVVIRHVGPIDLGNNLVEP